MKNLIFYYKMHNYNKFSFKNKYNSLNTNNLLQTPIHFEYNLIYIIVLNMKY